MPLRIGGLTPLSTTDYPGQLAAAVFCQGCPWRCGYCHNPHLIPATVKQGIDWVEVMRFLERRRGLLDAVVFSGGEPTLQPGLVAAMHKVRNLGFKVGLHTAGIYPARLARLLPLLNWVGLDIKAPFTDYTRITGVPGSGDSAEASLELILKSGVAHECRTTVHRRFFDAKALIDLAQALKKKGVNHYALQACRSTGSFNLSGDEDDGEWLRHLGQHIAPWFDQFTLRPA
ncbi:MAG: anaerobic ribonucleoside-triphosphate reductase activating protein [Burkholderiales bacterium]